jgi:uncharacterized protein YjcR
MSGREVISKGGESIMDAILLQYNGLVNRSQEKLAKLESCKAALKEKEAQFQRDASKLKEPAVSLENFKGSRATSFYTIRDVELYEEYQAIIQEQFTDNLEKLDTHIESLKESIQSTNQLISFRKEELKKESV